jgi:hypothetical protein
MTVWTIQWPTVPSPCGGTMAPRLQWAGSNAGFPVWFTASIKACDRLWGQSVMTVLNPTEGT